MRTLLAALLLLSSGAFDVRLAAVAGTPAAGRIATVAAYRELQRFTVGGPGDGGPLAIDPRAGRLFVGRTDRVEVLNSADGSLLKTIAAAPDVRGIALAGEIGRGFTSDGRANSVTAFDLSTLAPVGTIPVKGRDPDAILFDPASGNLYTFNDLSRDASVIDPVRGVTLATLGLGGRPGSAVADGSGRIYVDIEDTAEVAVIDSLSSRRIATWPLPECEQPMGIALDVIHHRLFSACVNSMLVVTNTDSGQRSASVPIGPAVRSAGFDPQRRLILLADAKGGELTVVHENDPDHYAVTGSVRAPGIAGPVALDCRTHRLYVVADRAGTAESARPAPEPPAIRGTPDRAPLTVLVLGN